MTNRENDNKYLSIFDKIRFGVIIRSIGERTEGLCYDSCLKAIPKEHIHIVKNYYPSYRAYIEMFRIAIDQQYDWYLALDADTVLCPNWLSLIADKISNYGDSKLFCFGHSVKDKFLGTIDRGNHCYNGIYSKKAIDGVLKSIKHTLKPEGGIKYNIEGIYVKRFSEQLIGYHGYEQYYKDIYYRFWNRRRRKPSQELKKLINKNLNNNQDYDRENEVGLLGWNSYNLMDHILARFFPEISNFSATSKKHEKIRKTLDKKNIIEKDELQMRYDQFIEKYGSSDF